MSEILNNLLRCNTHIKLKFEQSDDKFILNIFYNGKLLDNSVVLNSNILSDNANKIYDYITNIECITLYIPKIFKRE